MQRQTLAEQLAHSMVANQGIAMIWQLHIDAATLDRNGNPASAAALIEIADAAEREWLRLASVARTYVRERAA